MWEVSWQKKWADNLPQMIDACHLTHRLTMCVIGVLKIVWRKFGPTN